MSTNETRSRHPLRFIAAFVLLLALWPTLALAQSALLQGSGFTAGHVPMYVGAGTAQAFVQDSGPAGGGGPGLGLSELLLTARGTGTAPYVGQGSGYLGTNFCDYDAPTTNATGYHYLCWSPNYTGGNGGLVFGAAGGASTIPFVFNINGSAYQFPFSTSGVIGPATTVVNDAACWNNLVGTLLADCGAFVTVGGTNTWTGTNNYTGTFKWSSTTETFPPSGSIAGTTDVQTFTNKSISAAEINSGTLPGAQLPVLSGDVTSPGGSAVTTIAANAVTNAKLAQAVANTVKANGTGSTANETDFAMPSCSASGDALQWLTSTGFQCATLTNQTAGWGLTGTSTFSISTSAPPYGFGMPVNLGLTATVAASALTITLVAADTGSTPSASHPVLIPFRSTTLATGVPNWTAVTGALSIVINSGATLGTSNSTAFRVWIFAEYNSGTPELAVATCSLVATAVLYPCASWETNRVTSTTISGLATAPGTLYSTTGVSNDTYRIIGFCDYASGLSTVGAWASACTTLQPFGPGVPKPGSIVQGPLANTSTATVDSTSATKVEANPTQAIIPTSTPNFIKIHAVAGGVNPATNNIGCNVVLSRGTSFNTLTIGGTSSSNMGGAISTTESSMPVDGLDAPATVSSTTYVPFIYSGGSGTCNWNDTAGGSAPASYIQLEEIMGALGRPANDNINPGVFALTG